ncbi:mersacidin family lantibiotic [Alkalicoccobacillus gibsonii]|uniref:mersacidin family lantibiotic n=1 Tax=Alkalicoccobacillus gibsonii TaxID=79881 RepID=UPI001932985A|nr:mersacidin family lantibiotic [Alkalicoccobacillus gibsonii]MBM0067981.1 mersacidin family lantibiotic [Alkalicoccobacillus gibsonii]
MSNDERIRALKNPEFRDTRMSNPVGKTMNELSDEELAKVQGASDVSPETTPASYVTIGIFLSVKVCIGKK